MNARAIHSTLELFYLFCFENGHHQSNEVFRSLFSSNQFLINKKWRDMPKLSNKFITQTSALLFRHYSYVKNRNTIKLHRQLNEHVLTKYYVNALCIKISPSFHVVGKKGEELEINLLVAWTLTYFYGNRYQFLMEQNTKRISWNYFFYRETVWLYWWRKINNCYCSNGQYGRM